MIDSICRAQGYHTGLYISPHLVTFRERIRVNGEMISEDAVADGLTMIRDTVADWDPHPTFFEVATGLALKHFGDANIDIAILETGLGGVANDVPVLHVDTHGVVLLQSKCGSGLVACGRSAGLLFHYPPRPVAML